MPRTGRPREFDYAAARELRAAGWSLPRIARAFGRDHTSILYAVDPEFRKRKLARQRKARS